MNCPDKPNRPLPVVKTHLASGKYRCTACGREAPSEGELC